MTDIIEAYKYKLGRQFTCTANVTGPMSGDITEWPSKIQDILFKKIELLEKKHECKVGILASRCSYDMDTKWYVHIVVAEILERVPTTMEELLPLIDPNKETKQ